MNMSLEENQNRTVLIPTQRGRPFEGLPASLASC
jgi:hypothetical protein